MGMKSVSLSLIALTVISVVFSGVSAYAQQATMTDEHIASIKANCQQARASLAQLHANDALAYINRNQTYFSISDKMMARLNSRLALNRYDATQLVRTASDYNTALTRFRSTYKLYDDMVSDLLKMDCRKQPVEFYDRVSDARDQREKVHGAVLQLKMLIGQYGDAVTAFQVKHADELERGSHD